MSRPVGCQVRIRITKKQRVAVKINLVWRGVDFPENATLEQRQEIFELLSAKRVSDVLNELIEDAFGQVLA